jgi:phosphatidate cytidylyltransferase
LKTRVISAVVALSALIPCLILWEARAVEVLVALMMGAGLWEFARMALPGEKWAALPLLVAGGLIYSTALTCPTEGLHAAIVLSGLVLLAWSLLVPDTVEAAFARGGKLSFALLWIVGMGLHITLLANTDLNWAILLLLIVIAGDTGAYFSGRLFGKRKLFERVSPKKTWEGVYGGLLAAVLATLAFAHYQIPELTTGHAVALALLVGAAGVTGDLVESLVKRACDVKDSGAIMPGHGGALDRVDSLLLGAPVMFLYLELVLFRAA